MKTGPKIQTKTIQDILKRTERDGECCIWVGAKHVQGYGMMRQRGVMRTVHSVVAEIKFGYAPGKYSGERVTRTCGNIACVNPDHVEIVTAGSINAGKTFKRGRFSDDDIRSIRSEYDSYENKYGVVKHLAEKWNTSLPLMSSICRKRIYKRIK